MRVEKLGLIRFPVNAESLLYRAFPGDDRLQVEHLHKHSRRRF